MAGSTGDSVSNDFRFHTNSRPAFPSPVFVVTCCHAVGRLFHLEPLPISIFHFLSEHDFAAFVSASFCVATSFSFSSFARHSSNLACALSAFVRVVRAFSLSFVAVRHRIRVIALFVLVFAFFPSISHFLCLWTLVWLVCCFQWLDSELTVCCLGSSAMKSLLLFCLLSLAACADSADEFDSVSNAKLRVRELHSLSRACLSRLSLLDFLVAVASKSAPKSGLAASVKAAGGPDPRWLIVVWLSQMSRRLWPFPRHVRQVVFLWCVILCCCR